MNLRIATDIGGTFTDIVVTDEIGNVNLFKSSTTPNNHIEGIMNGLQLAAKHYNLDLPSFMDRCNFFCHGSTITTNAIITGNTAKVGLLCTKGHRDVLVFREAGKDHPYKWYFDNPEPYVPRHLTYSVEERINHEGKIIVELNESDVREAINKFKEKNVEIIAVSLLWSFANPAHEKRIAEIIKEEWPEARYTLSHLVNPRIREYGRTVSTAINASLGPLIHNYLGRFKDSLDKVNYKKDPYLFTSSGGLTLPEEMMEKPLYSLDSGPALAPVAGKFYADKELGDGNVITCDMGGTSFDLSRVTDHKIAVTNNVEIADERLSIPKVDVKTIGAGGGSIAWVDAGGLIRIGPEGAGSEPGPACYMRGGKRATVTDAALVLGYLDPNYFLGGLMTLNTKAAEEAIMKSVGEPLNLDLVEAALTIWNTATSIMTEAVRDITIWEGIDPTEYTMVGGGGAIGMHIVPIVEELGIENVIIPEASSTLSAYGGVIAVLVKDFERSYFTTTSDFNYEEVNKCLLELKNEAVDFLNKAGIPSENQVFEFSVESRYPFQEKDLSFTLDTDHFGDEEALQKTKEKFHDTHEKARGSRDSEQHVEFTIWKVQAKGLIPEIKIEAEPIETNTPSKGAKKEDRDVYFRDLGIIKTPIYNGEKLRPGNIVYGPAIIEGLNTNLVIFPNSSATITKYKNYLLKINSNKKTEKTFNTHKAKMLGNV
ncbi:N-methylhydantoinase A [Virgibacillus halotolerans]|uniref:hydantoinase/oxoprolinase family protein n=1 Tax=Virgibacillus halotolerans TaxID=1071053 RepID=UPI001960727B|nr:hydantoinase/oxoprolinase family protein [Virgibacillus halotolerans]MBM7599051.1 N-methylhydantoinase A [Virgibacillus halotolerans]